MTKRQLSENPGEFKPILGDCQWLNQLVRFALSVTGEQERSPEMLERQGFVSVKEAASILDVAPNTVRAWGATGKITEYRHPANNYRLYKRVDLEQILNEVQVPVSKRTTSTNKTRRNQR